MIEWLSLIPNNSSSMSSDFLEVLRDSPNSLSNWKLVGSKRLRSEKINAENVFYCYTLTSPRSYFMQTSDLEGQLKWLCSINIE